MIMKLCDPTSQEIASTKIEVRSEKKLFLSELLVQPQFRNQGYGYRLLKAVVDFATREGYSLVDTNLDFENKVGRQLLTRSGFKDAIIGTNNVAQMRLRVREFITRRSGVSNKPIQTHIKT